MPDQLLERLHAVRQRLRLIRVIAGCCQVIIALVSLIVAFFAIDFFITSRIFPSGRADLLARLVLIIAGIAAWFRVIYTGLWIPLVRRYTDDDIAMLVELHYPDLRGRLISIVQLTRAGTTDAKRYQASAQMIAALDEQTRAVADHLDFADLVNLKFLKRAALVALILCGLAVGLALWHRHYASALFKRLALSSASYPTAASIISYTRGGNLIAGRPLMIDVALDPHRFVPAEVHLLVQPTGRHRSYEIILRPEKHSANDFQGTISNTLDGFSYRIRAYDARTPWQIEHVWTRPSVKSISVNCIYPDYVHRPPDIVRNGDVVVPAGTLLKVTADLVYPCQNAEMTLRLIRPTLAASLHSAAYVGHHPSLSKLFTRIVPMQLDAKGMAAQCQWIANLSGTFNFHLTDRHGLSNLHPTLHVLEAVPDLPPVARILFPQSTEAATPFAAWPIRFSVSDDYGLTRVFLVIQVRRPREEATTQPAAPGTMPTKTIDADGYGPFHKISLPGLVGDRVRHLKNAHINLNFTALHLTPGCRVRYWIEAMDNHQPKANVGKSRRLRFRIEDPAILSATLARRNREAMRSLNKVRSRSGKVARTMTQLSHESPEKK